MRRLLLSLFRILALTTVVALGYFFLFQERMIYFPRPSPPQEMEAFALSGGMRLDYTTGEGRQTAWLQVPRDHRVPERFWIVCAGNGSRALQMAGLQEKFGLEQDAFLLVDYPGYGASQGKPNPASIRENFRIAVPLAARAAHFPEADLPTHGIVFGHSLGCAASLLGADIFGVRHAVLLAPFTSLMEMSGVVLPVRLDWLVRHRYDNRAELKKLAGRGGHVWIFHGNEDEYIPLRIGKTLALELGGAATFQEVPGASHNDLLEMAGQEIGQAMRQARE